MGSVGALPYGVNLAEKSCVTRCAFGSNADDLNRAQRLSSHVGKAGVGGTRKPHKYWQGEVGIDVSDVDRPVLSSKDFASDIGDPAPANWDKSAHRRVAVTSLVSYWTTICPPARSISAPMALRSRSN